MALCAHVSIAVGQEDAAARDLRESIAVERIQIDVSVIDPKGSERASVPGLPQDAFEVRVDGLPLEGERLEKTRIDEICPGESAEAESISDAETPTLVVLADLNFLDIPMRNRVRIALEDLADVAETRPVRVKVLVYADRLIPITAGFVSEPEQIRRAGGLISGSRAVGPALVQQANVPRVATAPAPLAPLNVQQLRTGLATIDDALQIRQSIFDGVDDLQPIRNSALNDLAARVVDPRPSLQAIESVLLSHASIPARKALVLFSSDLFDMPEELWPDEVADRSHVTQSGFTVWGIDARGPGVATRSPSRLLGHLASQTGGETLNSASRLSIAFDRALSELSCYYLVSVPVVSPEKGRKRISIDVRLDTVKYPDFWRYRIRAASRFVLDPPERQRERRRLAGLLVPDGFRFPEVRISAAYPEGKKSMVTPVEVSILLSDLLFVQRSASPDVYAAEFGWEGVVSSENGRTVCELGDGRRRSVRAAKQPAKRPPAQLVLRSRCRIPKPGTYEIRVVVEDLLTGSVGAASAFLDLPNPRTKAPSISALRLGRNSGRDFLLDGKAIQRKDGSQSVPRDTRRVGYTPLRPDEPIATVDRLILRFVACHWDPLPRIVLYSRESAGGEPVPRAQLVAAAVSDEPAEKRSCREYETIVPEKTLTPGRYGVAFVSREFVVEDLDDLASRLEELQLAPFIEFLVAEPPSEGEPRDEIQVSRR